MSGLGFAVRGLGLRYGQRDVLRDVELDVRPGEMVCLIGPNGAGKSSLLKAVAGLAPVQSGDVRFRGAALDGLPAHERYGRGICLIPEGRGIFPNLTVADNLRVALGDDRGAVARVVEFFPVLGERMGQLAATLSGGEQQMLALARAVGLQPALLMADELSLGLAPMLVQAVTDTLRRLHEEQGQTVLLVEQYVTQALRLADLVFILNQGRLVWAGEPAELSASHVLVESYLGAG